MKKFRKEFLFVLCFCMMLGLTACGRDDMGNQSTERNENNNMSNGDGGVIDDLGDAVGEGINDIGDSVENLTDDVTGNQTENRSYTRD